MTIMYSFACRDMGMDCDEVITGGTAEEVAQKAMAHAQEKHADVLKTMTSPVQMAQMQQQLQAAIKSV
jgi:predicted small metal-binding protein